MNIKIWFSQSYDMDVDEDNVRFLKHGVRIDLSSTLVVFYPWHRINRVEWGDSEYYIDGL